MGQESAHSVLARLLRKAGAADAPAEVTPARALKLSMARASEQSIGLTLSVREVAEDRMSLDTSLAALTPDLMLLELTRSAQTIGFAAFDLQLRTASVEVQTIGAVRATSAADRPMTAADAALCAPLVTAFMDDFARTAEGTDLGGWSDDVIARGKFDDSRAVGMALDDCRMHVVRMTVELAGADRVGTLVIGLPYHQVEADATATAHPPEFAQQLRETVMEVPAELQAVLHRLDTTLGEVRAFDVGQVIPLPGITVDSVRLEARGGRCFGFGKLGQMTGLRAVRLQQVPVREMTDAKIGGQGQPIADAVEDTALSQMDKGADPVDGAVARPVADATVPAEFDGDIDG